jgi:hypothetical protein
VDTFGYLCEFHKCGGRDVGNIGKFVVWPGGIGKDGG